MNLVQKTIEVITDAIESRASKNGVKKSEVQITLYAKSEKEIGVVWMKNGQAEAQTKINNILGSYALIPRVSSNVNNTIYNALNKFSQTFQTSIMTLNARLFIENEILKATLYLNGEIKKEISIEEIIN
jgi:uncharacterized protein YneF (UPF0154 family)